jgi:hypothetical protein
MAKNDTIHFWWNPKTRMYEEGDEMGPSGEGDYGPVYTPPAKKKLEDQGTRFEHLNDLLDYLGEGLIAVNNSLERYKNENDELRKKRLESSITLIKIYQDQMANIDGQKYDFNRLLDSCAPERGVLEAIKDERIAKARAEKIDKAEKAAGETND